MRAKYAVVTLSALETLVTARTFHPYFWARFAQPTGLLWSDGEQTTGRVNKLLARAVNTLARESRPLLESYGGPQDLFIRAFAETYRTELRAEGASRAAELVAHYETAIAALAPFCCGSFQTRVPEIGRELNVSGAGEDCSANFSLWLA